AAGRDFAVSEFARQHHRLLTRRGVARQVHSFGIVQAFSPVGDMKMVPRHGGARSVSERPPAVTRFRLRAQTTRPAGLLTAGCAPAHDNVRPSADPPARGELARMRSNI